MVPLSVLIDALTLSNLLALMTLGLSLTYMTLRVSNFAHGDFATIGAYITYTLLVFYSVNPYLSLPFSFILGGIISLIMYVLILRPLQRRGANLVILMVATVGFEVIIRNVLHIYADTVEKLTNRFFRSFIIRDSYIPFMGSLVPQVTITSTCIVISLLLTLYIVLTRTKLGIAMRAAIENPQLASALGIDVEKVYMISWFLAGGLTAIAGSLLPYRLPCNPETGWLILLRVFAAAILGGINSIWGSIAGSYIIGFSEVVGIYVLAKPPLNLPTTYKPLIPFSILIITLLLLPNGITGINWQKVSIRLRRR